MLTALTNAERANLVFSTVQWLYPAALRDEPGAGMAHDTTGSRSSTYDGALRELGRALTDLKRRRGAPSYDRIRVRGLKVLQDSQASSSKGTMSAVFAGQQYISLDKLLWLARAVMSWDEDGAECDPPARRDPVLDPWRKRWIVIDSLRAARRRLGTDAEQALEPGLPAPETAPSDTSLESDPSTPSIHAEGAVSVSTQPPPDPSSHVLQGGVPLTDRAGPPRSVGFSSARRLPGTGSEDGVYRPHRLEVVFGDRLDMVSHEQIASLVLNSVTEDNDLEFKIALFDWSDRKARHAFAGDVAAFANSSGGVMVFGIAEDQTGAVAAPGVPLSGTERDRIQGIIAHCVHPHPGFEVRSVQDPKRAGHGFLLLIVPRSPLAPHAIAVDERSLRYPRRYGSMITYLSEAEVAQAYQERFVGLQ